MKDGFIKVAAVTPDIRVGDTKFNTKSIIKNIMAVYEIHVATCSSRTPCYKAHLTGLQKSAVSQAVIILTW